MRVLVVSDSHGRNQNLETVMERVKPDLMFHLGDSEDDDDLIAAEAPCEVVFVKGNCDYGNIPVEEVVELGRHKVFLTHGHYYSVRMGLNVLAQAAKERGCDVAIFGHTHVPEMEEEDGVTIYNPGSISLPRQDGRKPTFMVLDVDERGDIHASLNVLK